jgi:hypothetical protein
MAIARNVEFINGHPVVLIMLTRNKRHSTIQLTTVKFYFNCDCCVTVIFVNEMLRLCWTNAEPLCGELCYFVQCYIYVNFLLNNKREIGGLFLSRTLWKYLEL